MRSGSSYPRTGCVLESDKDALGGQSVNGGIAGPDRKCVFGRQDFPLLRARPAMGSSAKKAVA
jgi:hypothetical protein